MILTALAIRSYIAPLWPENLNAALIFQKRCMFTETERRDLCASSSGHQQVSGGAESAQYGLCDVSTRPEAQRARRHAQEGKRTYWYPRGGSWISNASDLSHYYDVIALCPLRTRNHKNGVGVRVSLWLRLGLGVMVFPRSKAMTSLQGDWSLATLNLDWIQNKSNE